MYEWVISGCLPTGRFVLIDAVGSVLIEFSDDSPKGCIVEFDPEYPEYKELHHLRNDYHLAP